MRARDLTPPRRRHRTICSSSAAAFTVSRAPTTRRAAGFASRWSRRTTSAAAPRSIIRRPRTAACARSGRGHLARARESIRERRALARIAPWFLRPLPFLVGTYRSVVRRTGSRCARRSSSTRGSAGTATTASNPSCTCRRRGWSRRPRPCGCFAGVRPEGLTGGAQWYDYQMVEADRLTFAFAAAADRAGADLANYVEAIERDQRGRHAIAGMIVARSR